MDFRTLRADEIECRVNTISEKGCSLLLYKDARADMTLLDEIVKPENWQRNHELINGNLFCNVGIKIDGEWIWKQDVGKVSNTEAEKGQASDAFKRACVNWGIGRELYTAPFIWVGAENVNIVDGKNGKKSTFDTFKVKDISYNDKREIISLTIVNDKRNKVVYSMGVSQAEPTPEAQNPAIEEASAKAKVLAYINKCGMSKDNIEALCRSYKIDSIQNMTLAHCNHYISFLRSKGVEIE